MESAFLLGHVHEMDFDRENIKIIGIFSTKDEAENAKNALSILPGFKDYPDGFFIDEYRINEINWVDGFGI